MLTHSSLPFLFICTITPKVRFVIINNNSIIINIKFSYSVFPKYFLILVCILNNQRGMKNSKNFMITDPRYPLTILILL